MVDSHQYTEAEVCPEFFPSYFAPTTVLSLSHHLLCVQVALHYHIVHKIGCEHQNEGVNW